MRFGMEVMLVNGVLSLRLFGPRMVGEDFRIKGRKDSYLGVVNRDLASCKIAAPRTSSFSATIEALLKLAPLELYASQQQLS